MNICFLNYLSPDVVSIQPNLTFFYYFLPLISNLFGDIVICWVLTMLPNLEASVICINKRIPLFNLLIKTLRNNISIKTVLPIWEHWHFYRLFHLLYLSLFPNHSLLQSSLILVPSKTLKHWFCGKWSAHLQAHVTLPSLAGRWETNTAEVTLGHSSLASFSHVDCDSIFLLHLTELYFFNSGYSLNRIWT